MESSLVTATRSKGQYEESDASVTCSSGGGKTGVLVMPRSQCCTHVVHYTHWDYQWQWAAGRPMYIGYDWGVCTKTVGRLNQNLLADPGRLRPKWKWINEMKKLMRINVIALNIFLCGHEQYLHAFYSSRMEINTHSTGPLYEQKEVS